MSLLYMSFSGAVIISVIAVIRALFINKLTSFPSVFSVYSLKINDRFIKILSFHVEKASQIC